MKPFDWLQGWLRRRGDRRTDRATPSVRPADWPSADHLVAALSETDSDWRRAELVWEITAETRTADGRDRLLAQLARLDGPGWVRVDAAMRLRHWSRSLEPVEEGNHLASVALASMGPDGYVRERATQRLAAAAGPVAAMALALRTVDWVPVIADLARTALSSRAVAGPSDAAAAVPVLVALEGRSRAVPLAAEIIALARTSPDHRRALLASRDRATRRRFSSDEAVLGACTEEDLDDLVADGDPLVAARAAATSAARAQTTGNEPRLHGLLRGPVRVRVAVLDALVGSPRSAELASSFLFSSSRAARRAAQDVLRRSGMDPVDPYLRTPRSGRLGVIAVEEIGLLLGVRGREILAAGLAADDPAMRIGSMRGTRFLPDLDQVALLSPLLRDPAPEVVRAVGRRLRSAAGDLDGAELREMLTGLPHERLVAARLLRRRTAPERIWADLASIELGDERERARAIEDIGSFLRRGAASARWAERRQRLEMAAAVDRIEPQLPDGLATSLRFNAGLRLTDLEP